MEKEIYNTAELMPLNDDQFNKIFLNRRLVITWCKLSSKSPQIFTGYLVKTANINEGLSYSEKHTTHLRFIKEKHYNMFKCTTSLISNTILLFLLEIQSIEIQKKP